MKTQIENRKSQELQEVLKGFDIEFQIISENDFWTTIETSEDIDDIISQIE
jgi:hypothetical protein